MEKLIIIIALFVSHKNFAQIMYTYQVSSISYLKTFSDSRYKRLYVIETNADYVLCTNCTVDNVNVYQGASSKKWKKVGNTEGTNGTNGSDGATGATGATGDKGDKGEKGDIGNTGANGINGTNGNNGTTGAMGSAGTNGTNGIAATVAIGTTTTGAAGSNATVTNSGTSSAAIFNFTIPRGNTGLTGATGNTGTATGVSIANVSKIVSDSLNANKTTFQQGEGISIVKSNVTNTYVISAPESAMANAQSIPPIKVIAGKGIGKIRVEKSGANEYTIWNESVPIPGVKKSNQQPQPPKKKK